VLSHTLVMCVVNKYQHTIFIISISSLITEKYYSLVNINIDDVRFYLDVMTS